MPDPLRPYRIDVACYVCGEPVTIIIDPEMNVDEGPDICSACEKKEN